MALPSINHHLPFLLLHLLTTTALIFIILPSPSHQSPDPHLIDRIIRDSAFHSYPKHHKTAILYKVQLPPTLSGVTANTARFRAGSLRRHGAVVKEFKFPPGIAVHTHMKRLIMVVQNLANHSFIYNNYYHMSGYHLTSPVLGLLIYDATNLNCSGHYNSTKYLSELEVFIAKKPITVDFSSVVGVEEARRSRCVLFELDGRVILSNQTRRGVCVAWRQGHFGLAVKHSTSRQGSHDDVMIKGGIGWKVVAASTVGGAFGAVLLGLVVVAAVSVRRRRWRAAEMERRAYEEEALQVSMVGHVRAPTAAVARTAPALENDYDPSCMS